MRPPQETRHIIWLFQIPCSCVDTSLMRLLSSALRVSRFTEKNTQWLHTPTTQITITLLQPTTDHTGRPSNGRDTNVKCRFEITHSSFNGATCPSLRAPRPLLSSDVGEPSRSMPSHGRLRQVFKLLPPFPLPLLIIFYTRTFRC